MVDITALMEALPVSGLEPQSIALISGILYPPHERSWTGSIMLLEPPAHHHAPYIEPFGALQTIFSAWGKAQLAAGDAARECVVRMRVEIADERWANFLDSEPDSPECLPVWDFVSWFRRQGSPSLTLEIGATGTAGIESSALFTHMLNFFENTARVVSTEPIFEGWSERGESLSLEALHALPAPWYMVEFVPGAPWLGPEVESANDSAYEPFLRWREGMRTVAAALEQVLGKEVYYFADLNCEIDDDYMHRFLVLHWCCTYKPESAYVKYLTKVSKAKDVEALKAALVDATNYTYAFDLQRLGRDPDARMCRFEYLPPARE
ncbi:hypothetical protein [Pseudomonas massiliensis]|uniref:hypothetical protein n=1 Tax=Pseudomonas massiliensis TaxID=522492 RepID=UPI00058D5B36|nr:hypothetical protein [Pseudomonas massiliensis]